MRLTTLRDIKSKIMVEATSASGQEITDAVVLKICMKLHNRERGNLCLIFRSRGEDDLAKEEFEQAEIIETFLPKMFSEDEVRAEVVEAIKVVGTSEPPQRILDEVYGDVPKSLRVKQMES